MPAKALLSLDDLAEAGLSAPSDELQAVAARYSVAVPPEIAALIDRRDAADPIARQFIPDPRELIAQESELEDPIGDAAHSPVPGIVHRYEDRVLLKLLSVCPVYCRFCFRRETVGRGKGGALSGAELAAALRYVASHPEVREVILTGGDPMAASPRRLRDVAAGLAQISHVTKLRVHTRVPIAAPALVTAERISALQASGKRLYVALHVNHARELSEAARAAIARLRDADAALLAQTVLLAGVNDDASTLQALMRAVVALGVKPYYLHHPDRAPGTAHFRLTIDRGRGIYGKLKADLGADAPRYVLDIPGGFGKVPIEEPHLVKIADGCWRAVDRFGVAHEYLD
jgi:lysine 2,3-aminomutase